MNPTLMLGTRIVVLALLSYTIAIYIEQRIKLFSNRVLIPLTLGLVFDITATLFMIIGSPNSPFTVHGFLGYSALLAMLIETSLAWRYRIIHDDKTRVPYSLHIYSRYAYGWWVIAFITGGVMVLLK